MEELIQKTINGDDCSYVELYNECKKKINSLLFKKYPNNIHHDDDVHEILYKIFKNIEKYDSKKASFATWSNRLAVNYMIDKHRKKNMVYYVSTMSNSDTVNYTSNDYHYSTYNVTDSRPDLNFENFDSVENIKEIVSEKEFDIMKLKYVDGYSCKEIGKTYNITDKEVSSRLFYSKQKIKRAT